MVLRSPPCAAYRGRAVDHPVFVALLVIAAVYCIGRLVESWSWSRAVAVIGAAALLAESLWLYFR